MGGGRIAGGRLEFLKDYFREEIGIFSNIRSSNFVHISASTS